MSFFRRFRDRSPEGSTPLDDGVPDELSDEQEDAESKRLFVGSLSWDTDDTSDAASKSGEIVAADFDYEAKATSDAAGDQPDAFSADADEASALVDLQETSGPATLGSPAFDVDPDAGDLSELAEDLDA